MFLSNLAMSRKFALAYLAVGAIIVGSNGAALWNLSAIDSTETAQQESYAGVEAALFARLALARVENSYRGYLLSSDNYYVERIDKHQGALMTQLEKLRTLTTGRPDVLALIDKAESGILKYRQDIIEAGKKLAADPATHDRAVQMVGPDAEADALIAPIEDAIDAIIEDEKRLTTVNTVDQGATISRATNAIYLGLGISLLIAIGLGYLLTRLIAVPIRGLTRTMGELAAGNTAADVPELERADEVGQMARAVQVFKEGQLEKTRLESEAIRTREEIEDERVRGEADKAREAAEDRAAIAAIAAGLSKLAEGDLTYRIGENFAPKLQQLKSDFNSAIAQLQDTVSTIGGAVGMIKTGTSEISQAADDLSRRTEQQAASLEQTAAALDEVVATVKNTAEGARKAASVTGEARDGAVHSGEVMSNAIRAMAEIEKSSEKISQIIGVIDEIAFQTNLLALNAGVEAARAGEAGKGFAVVASEVRALAQRSAEAAKEIKALISTSTHQVEEGVSLVGQTGTALKHIAARVTEMSELVNSIAHSAQDQSTALAEVNVAVGQMDQVTQQNAAMVEESTAASHSLAREADELASLIARFRFGPESTARSAPKRHAVQSMARPVPALKTVSTGSGPATVTKAEIEDDAWEEF